MHAKSVAMQLRFLCLLTSTLALVAQDKLAATPHAWVCGFLQGAPYWVRRRWDDFAQYGLGVTPPRDFAIPEQHISCGRRERRR